MILSQAVTAVGQIDVGKVSTRPCEYFGVNGCVLAPLGEARVAVQYLILRPLITSGGKTTGRNGEGFDMLFNCACAVTKGSELW